jgi:hypothetical protein
MGSTACCPISRKMSNLTQSLFACVTTPSGVTRTRVTSLISHGNDWTALVGRRAFPSNLIFATICMSS